MCGGMFSGKQARLQMIADAQKEAAQGASYSTPAQTQSSGQADAVVPAQAASAAQPAPGVVVKGVASNGYEGQGTRNARLSASDAESSYSDINKRRKRKTALSGLGL